MRIDLKDLATVLRVLHSQGVGVGSGTGERVPAGADIGIGGTEGAEPGVCTGWNAGVPIGGTTAAGVAEAGPDAETGVLAGDGTVVALTADGTGIGGMAVAAAGIGVGATEVGAGETGVLGGTGVDGTGVAVDSGVVVGTGVSVDNTGVFVGAGNGVAVGGTGVGGEDVAVAGSPVGDTGVDDSCGIWVDGTAVPTVSAGVETAVGAAGTGVEEGRTIGGAA